MKARIFQSPINVNPWLVAFIVSIATFMEVLDTTITNVSLSHISGSLGSSYDESTWILTSYLVSNGIIIPMSGWISNTIGRKNYFMICISCFTAASFACGAATSLPMLIFFRLIQGLAGGGLQPVQQSIILDAFPPDKRAAAFGITSVTMIVAPILGPTLGGWITDNFSWRWIFYINVPVGIIAFLLVARFVSDSVLINPDRKKNIDFIGISLVALGLGSLQIILDKGQQEDWFHSNFILFFSIVTIVSLSLAIYWLSNREDPIINLSLFKDKAFRMAFVMIFVTGFLLYASSMLLPLIVQTQLGYTAMLAGLVISPGGIAVIILMPFIGKLSAKFQTKNLIMFGFTLAVLGMWNSSMINPYIDYNSMVWIRIGQVICLPFLFIPVSILAYRNISKEQNNKASALFAMGRNLGGSVGIAFTNTFLARNQQIHQNYLVDNISDYDPQVQQSIDEVARNIIEYGGEIASANMTATGKVYQELIKQSAFLSYQNAFELLMYLGIFALIFSMFTPKSKTNVKIDISTIH